VNSYKRLVSGFDAPVYETWGVSDQTAVVRVPTPKVGKASAARIEYRAPDPACNPYLTFSVILAAGLAGIDNSYELPERPGEVAGPPVGAHRLPASLAEALDAMEGSELVHKALGDHVFSWFLKNKRREWERYEHHVSRFELDNYLPVL
jgi:glutamine synthetase